MSRASWLHSRNSNKDSSLGMEWNRTSRFWSLQLLTLATGRPIMVYVIMPSALWQMGTAMTSTCSLKSLSQSSTINDLAFTDPKPCFGCFYTPILPTISKISFGFSPAKRTISLTLLQSVFLLALDSLKNFSLLLMAPSLRWSVFRCSIDQAVLLGAAGLWN